MLTETPDGWTETVPSHCPECGHRWTRGQFRNSWLPCNCAGEDGHRCWECVNCAVETYVPRHKETGTWQGVASALCGLTNPSSQT